MTMVPPEAMGEVDGTVFASGTVMSGQLAACTPADHSNAIHSGVNIMTRRSLNADS